MKTRTLGNLEVPELGLGALAVRLSPEDDARIEEVMPRGAAAGLRHPAPPMARVNA